MMHRPRTLRTPRGARPAGRRGSVLIVAMVILFALSAMVLVMARSVRVEAAASANAAAAIQAEAVARAAEQWMIHLVTEEGPDVLERPEHDFMQRQVGDGYFWIVRPLYEDRSLPEFGLMDEAARINLNRVSEEALRRVPGMDDQLAAAILDWRDQDDEPRPNGAESAHYLSLARPYRAKNARFESVEELLLVRGVTPELLYGDPAALLDSAARRSAAFSRQTLVGGLSDIFTVYSIDPQLTNDGERRIYANSSQQRDRLRDAIGQRLGSARADEIVGAIGQGNLRDIFDFYFRTGMSIDEFRQVEDLIRTTRQRRRRGLININTAPREALLGLDELLEEDVDTLIAARPGYTAQAPTSVAWVAEVLGERAVGLGSQITGRACQFSADIVAISGDGRAFHRVRIVVDTAQTPPQVVYRRDITSQGWPLDPQILESIRRGEQSPPQSGRLENRF